LVWLKLELETRIKIMFLNFFCIIGPSCIIIISMEKVDVFEMSDQAIHVFFTILATNICFNTSLRKALCSDIVSRSDG